MASERLLLGIDGGQTATKALLVTTGGRVVAEGVGSPIDHFHAEGGEERNRAAIQGAIRSALAAAGASGTAVVAVALGLTGAPTESGHAPVAEGIVREVMRPERVVVVPDYVTNLAGASGGEPGVVVIAGGGAIAYGASADGRETVVSGFGYLLGDEGSGFDIGRRAIGAATRASDGRGPATMLEAVVLSAFGLRTMRDITRVVYDAGFRRDRISRLAPLVAEAAAEGDAVAAGILAGAGEELGCSALAAIRRLAAPGDAATVYPTGGVFAAGEEILEPFRATVRNGWPEAAICRPRFAPVVGGVILAARTVGIAVGEGWLRAVAATTPG